MLWNWHNTGLRRIFSESKYLGRQRPQIIALSTINATPTSQFLFRPRVSELSSRLHLVNTFPHLILFAPHQPRCRCIKSSMQHNARGYKYVPLWWCLHITFIIWQLLASDTPGKILSIAEACSSDVCALSVPNQEACTWEASLRHLSSVFVFRIQSCTIPNNASLNAYFTGSIHSRTRQLNDTQQILRGHAMTRPCHRRSTWLWRIWSTLQTTLRYLLLHEFQHIPSPLGCLGRANRKSKGDNLQDLRRSILILHSCLPFRSRKEISYKGAYFSCNFPRSHLLCFLVAHFLHPLQNYGPGFWNCFGTSCSCGWHCCSTGIGSSSEYIDSFERAGSLVQAIHLLRWCSVLFTFIYSGMVLRQWVHFQSMVNKILRTP